MNELSYLGIGLFCGFMSTMLMMKKQAFKQVNEIVVLRTLLREIDALYRTNIRQNKSCDLYPYGDIKKVLGVK